MDQSEPLTIALNVDYRGAHPGWLAALAVQTGWGWNGGVFATIGIEQAIENGPLFFFRTPGRLQEPKAIQNLKSEVLRGETYQLTWNNSPLGVPTIRH